MVTGEPVAVDDDDGDLEPLFDYSRVQPLDIVSVDDDDDDGGADVVAIFCGAKRKRSSEPKEGEKKDSSEVAVVEADVRGDSKKEDDAWLLPPPKMANLGTAVIEDKTLQELRLKKQELASFAKSPEDVLQAVIEAAKREIRRPEKSVELEANQPSLPRVPRQKIVISIQDKDGQKQFRIYMDDKFERLFKMYAERVNLKLESLIFRFDGDKVSPTATPGGLGLEDEDIIEVHVKSQ